MSVRVRNWERQYEISNERYLYNIQLCKEGQWLSFQIERNVMLRWKHMVYTYYTST